MPQNEFEISYKPSGQYLIPGSGEQPIEFIFLDERTRRRVPLTPGCRITFEDASDGAHMHVKDTRGNPLLIGLKGRDRYERTYTFERVVAPTRDFFHQAAQFLAENAGSIPLQAVTIKPGEPIVEPLARASTARADLQDSDDTSEDTARLRMSAALDERLMFRLVGT